MQPASYHLENSWSPEGGKHGRLTPPRFIDPKIAEAAWTPKDWLRFAAIAPLSPKL